MGQNETKSVATFVSIQIYIEGTSCVYFLFSDYYSLLTIIPRSQISQESLKCKRPLYKVAQKSSPDIL